MLLPPCKETGASASSVSAGAGMAGMGLVPSIISTTEDTAQVAVSKDEYIGPMIDLTISKPRYFGERKGVKTMVKK